MSVDSACPTEAAPLEGEACAHTPCYCEENVWRLIAQQPAPLRQHLWAVFISNPNKAVPLWQQRAGREAEEGFCLWDYVSTLPALAAWRLPLRPGICRRLTMPAVNCACMPLTAQLPATCVLIHANPPSTHANPPLPSPPPLDRSMS